MLPLQIRDTNFIYHKIGGHDDLFQLSDIDDAGATKYYGYLSAEAWIIIEENTTNNTYRYVGGSPTSAYKTAVTGKWATRALLTYGYYDALFS